MNLNIKKYIFNILVIAQLALLFLPLSATAIAIESDLTEKEVEQAGFDYPRIWAMTRELLTRAPVKKFLKEEMSDLLKISPEEVALYGFDENVRNLSEGQLFTILRAYPRVWPAIEDYIQRVPRELTGDSVETDFRDELRKALREFLREPQMQAELKRLNQPTKTVQLTTQNGEPGYQNLNIYFNHPRYSLDRRKVLAPDSLEKVWIEFINGAKKELVLNVFEFDLESVAEAVIAAHKRGVHMRIGVHAENMTRERQAAVVKKLTENGISPVLVETSSSLNHQKIIARDWSVLGQGAVLFSSGNATRSCIGEKGDLGVSHPKSIPNANNVITLQSDIVANLVNHELTKTLDMKLKGRVGEGYPLGSAYSILGPNDTYMVIAFSPHGGLGDINKHILSRLLVETEGPIRMAQFAFSSDTFQRALLERAKREIAAGRSFDFRAVGDKPFALEYWSGFLAMSGFAMDRLTREYSEVKNSEFEQILGPEAFQRLLTQIRVAPRAYGNFKVFVDGDERDVNAKIHHKLISSGRASTPGTSYNFSENALGNQEQVVIVADAEITATVNAAIDWLIDKSTQSVRAEAKRRLGLQQLGLEIKKTEMGDEVEDQSVTGEAQ